MRIVAGLGALMIVCASSLAGQGRTPLKVTRLFTGADGETHAEITELKLQPSALRAGLDESASLKASGGRFMRWPRGYVWDWHNASERQYVITISGRSEVEVADGRKFVLKPGDVVLAEDVTGKGHITRSIGAEDLVLLLIPVAAQ